MTRGAAAIMATMIFLLLGLIRPALADGGFFSTIDKPLALSSDQRAIMILVGHTVSLTLSTAYSGDGSDFAWIIPVPALISAENVIEPGAAGEEAFQRLDGFTAPRTFYRVESFSGCGGCGGAAAPGGGSSGEDETGEPLVTEIDALELESYEGHVLAGSSATALAAWLVDNGYAVSPEAAAALSGYIDAGCSFVALRLKPLSGVYENEFLPAVTVNYPISPATVSFPLVISSASSPGEVRLKLFVIGQHNTSSTNFITRELDYSADAFPSRPRSYVDRRIRKTQAGDRSLVVIYGGWLPSDLAADLAPLFAGEFPGNQVFLITRLEGFISPEMMDEDILLVGDEITRYFAVEFEVFGPKVHWPGLAGGGLLVVIGLAMRRKFRRGSVLPLS